MLAGFHQIVFVTFDWKPLHHQIAVVTNL